MSEPVKVTETTIAPDGTITATIELTKDQAAFMDRSMLNGFSISEDPS